MYNASGVRIISHVCTSHDQQITRHVTHMYSPFPNWRETRNGQRDENQYPKWLKYRFLVKWAVWKETCGDHSGFQSPFQWSFRVSCLEKWALPVTNTVNSKWIQENRDLWAAFVPAWYSRFSFFSTGRLKQSWDRVFPIHLKYLAIHI